jgi:hypothetical protein
MILCTGLIVLMNVVLLWQTFGLPLPAGL